MTDQSTGRRPLPDRAATEKLYRSRLATFTQILEKTSSKLQRLLEKEGLTVTLKARVKRFENYYDKLASLSRARDSEGMQICDLFGLRVVCPFLEDLERVEQLIGEHFEVLELEHKGERHSFREFGYDSVHLLVRLEGLPAGPHLPYSREVCEIQLRTILQDAWAEVEHELVYKSDIDLPNDSIRRKLAALNASLALSDLIFQEIRNYQKEVRERGIKRRQTVEKILGHVPQISISSLPDLGTGDLDSEAELTGHLASQTLEASMFQALDAHSNNQFAAAIDIYSRILRLRLDPRIRSLVYNHRGMALFALAEYQRAVDDFGKAIQYNEENVRAWTNRGLVFRVQQRFDLSLADYRQAIDIAPHSVEGYWGRAQTCYEMKLYSRALADCQQVLGLQPDFTPAIELEKTLRRQMF